jgi:hypothetical protein
MAIYNRNSALKYNIENINKKELDNTITLFREVAHLIKLGSTNMIDFNFVINYFNKVEIESSSHIEGIYTTLPDLDREYEKTKSKFLDINPTADTVISRTNEEQLFYNNLKIIRMKSSALYNDKPFGTNAILNISKLMFKDINDHNIIRGISGTLKSTPNTIMDKSTDEVIFQPAGVDILNAELKAYDDFYHQETSTTEEVIINSAILHS